MQNQIQESDGGWLIFQLKPDFFPKDFGEEVETLAFHDQPLGTLRRPDGELWEWGHQLRLCWLFFTWEIKSKIAFYGFSAANLLQTAWNVWNLWNKWKDFPSKTA